MQVEIGEVYRSQPPRNFISKGKNGVFVLKAMINH